MPITLYPSFFKRPATTDESTPPDIATTIRELSGGPGKSRLFKNIYSFSICGLLFVDDLLSAIYCYYAIHYSLILFFTLSTTNSTTLLKSDCKQKRVMEIRHKQNPFFFKKSNQNVVKNDFTRLTLQDILSAGLFY